MDTNIHTKYQKNFLQEKRLFEYDIANKSEKHSFFDIHYLQEAVDNDHDLINMPHMHDFYLIVWFIEGTGKHITDFKEYEVNAGTILFISPKQLHKFKDMSHYKGVSIVFTEYFLCNLSEIMRKHVKNEIFNSLQPTVCYINNESAKKEIGNELRKIADEYEKGKLLYGHRDKLASLLSSFIIALKRNGEWGNQQTNENNSNDCSCYQDFICQVENNFRQVHQVKDYAKALAVSIGTLNKSVLKVSGKRPFDIINERIILEAKKMLNFSLELKVKQVAGELGFKDASNFVKFFKHFVGMSPSEFRGLN